MKTFKQLFKVNSLKARLIFSSMLMIVVVLPIIGFTISAGFERKLTSSIENELSAHAYAILSVAEYENGGLFMPEQLMVNQLNVSQSGLYAQITTIKKGHSSEVGEVLWSSNSLLGLGRLAVESAPFVGETRFNEQVFNDSQHFIFSLSVSYSEALPSETLENKLEMPSVEQNTATLQYPVTVHIFKDRQDFNTAARSFNQELTLWLSVLMLLLFFVQWAWLLWTLKPLRQLKRELAAIEQGRGEVLGEHYPQELEKIVNQLNLLLATEKKQRKRYRNALSDLAHSLKTPLAVIQTQQDLSNESQLQLSAINQMVEHQLKRAQSAGESAWHLGVKVEPLLTKLTQSLNKIYRNKSIVLSVQCDESAVFKGDEADLMEILGNLLDNAYKAAKGRVEVKIVGSSSLAIVIRDDGEGIADNQIKEILQRGHRADTYQKGHGIGLAIVKDLVESYQGELNIMATSALGGASFSIKLNK